MKTECCNQKIEDNERFCSDCGWESRVYNEHIQLEFPFVQPFIDAVQAKKQADIDYWKRFVAMTDKMFPNAKNYDWKGIFDDVQPMVYDGPLIPLTIVVGERNQFEFPFTRAMEEAVWGGIGTVKFDYELTKI